MITAQEILITLENHHELRQELGADWPVFYQKLMPLLVGFPNTNDPDEFELATHSIWKLCRVYPPVRELIKKRSVIQKRKLPSGDFGGQEVPISEIANRFQALGVELEKIGQPEIKPPPPDQHRETTNNFSPKP
ncbi:MAG: hypothetical protein JXM69_15065 [Anaerolineae bacterium]|nr:hypothetical protein [Anaerolineae bacterium]